MGKTSAIVRAVERHEKAGGVAFLADMSTASTLVDIANRILDAAGRALGRKWKDVIADYMKGFGGISLTFTPDPLSGVVVPSIEVKARSAPLDEQRASLARILDGLDSLAKARKVTIGIVLDEFQEIQRFGGDAAEWHLRGIIQHHKHVSYVLAGSQAHIIGRMLDKGRAFYGLADQLEFGAIDPAHMAKWIDDRMTRAGVKAKGTGASIVALSGPRTRDIVQVARQCFDNARGAGEAKEKDVAQAFDDVVSDQEAVFETIWRDLTSPQQNVLRAVATNAEGLTTANSLARFGIASSGGAINTATALIGDGHLVKADVAVGYAFENPFFRRWVEVETLGDLGAAAGAIPSRP
jgi:hypothetical protein